MHQSQQQAQRRIIADLRSLPAVREREVVHLRPFPFPPFFHSPVFFSYFSLQPQQHDACRPLPCKISMLSLTLATFSQQSEMLALLQSGCCDNARVRSPDLAGPTAQGLVNADRHHGLCSDQRLIGEMHNNFAQVVAPGCAQSHRTRRQTSWSAKKHTSGITNLVHHIVQQISTQTQATQHHLTCNITKLHARALPVAKRRVCGGHMQPSKCSTGSILFRHQKIASLHCIVSTAYSSWFCSRSSVSMPIAGAQTVMPAVMLRQQALCPDPH